MSRVKWVVAGALASVIVVLTAGAQAPPAGARVETFRSLVDGTEQPYALYVPKTFDPAKKYPLVIALHGEGSNHIMMMRHLFGRGTLPGQMPVGSSRIFPPVPDVDFLVAAPLARGTIGYQGLGERDVYDLLAELEKKFPVDEDRVYLTGESMGGGGTLWLGLTRPDIWAAIAPVCADAPTNALELADNALNLPVRLFHGELDPLIPPARSREWQKVLLRLDSPVEYVEYAQARHNAWDFAYRNASLFDWLAQKKRNRTPERVRFFTRAYEYRKAYWVELDALTPGTLAEIDARFTSPNHITVTTQGLDGFTLHLAGHPSYRPTQPLDAVVDGYRLSLPRRSDVSLVRTVGAWRIGNYKFDPGEKRPGTEGPMLRAVSGRQIFVYGTADGPGPVELERRRKLAADAADWSWMDIRPQLTPRISADATLTDTEMAGANLILFGTRETNLLIARWANLLPMQLNAGAADFGLLQLVAADGRYLLVSSGKPWWIDAAARKSSRYLAAKFGVLATFGDYILFKNSLRDVVAEGTLDREWQMPVAEIEKLKASGAVTLKSP